MFDEFVVDATGVTGAAAVSAWARVENAACARRLSAMVDLLDAAYAAHGVDRDEWLYDTWAAVGAHIGAVQAITSGAAANLLIVAVALRERFPKVAAVFADGLIPFALARAIVTRGALVLDPDALDALDSALADALMTWAPMGKDKTEHTLDGFIHRFDPHAVRRRDNRARNRSVEVTVDDDSGLAEVYATLFVHDATAFTARLDALADTVCPADPRTRDQRRADAVGALGNANDHLPCLCDTADCTADQNPPSTGVIVHVVAHEATIGGPGGPDEPPGDTAAEECSALDGVSPPLFDTPLRDLTLTQALTDSDPGGFGAIPPAALVGGRFLPGPVARRAALGAKVVTIVHPGQAPPEPHYTPSRKLADFVRCRDLTCRYPGCTVPATNCDVDHTIPWPFGPTQAANLKCLCRQHHLLKTFWVGPHGWRDRQHPDGTVVWTAPDGREHTTTPGSRLLFPSLSEPTAPVAATEVPTTHATGVTMPRRTTTRRQDRLRRIHDERELNRLTIDEGAAKEPTPEPIPPF